MRATIRVLAVAIGILLATSAWAQAQKPRTGEPRAQFVDMTETVFDGYIRRPSMTMAEGRVKPSFERLARFQTSFLRQALETAKEPVFR